MLPPPIGPALTLPLIERAVLRELTLHDFAAWMDLRNEVLGGLAHRDMYVREDDEAIFLAQNALPLGHCIGVFVDAQLVAYAMLGMPGPGEADHLGAVIGLPPEEQVCVSHLASCMVRRAWRGKQLQALLLKLRYALAQAYHRPLCLAMVSLHNAASRRNLLAQGMWIDWTGDIDGLQRHVLRIDLQRRLQWDLQGSRLIAGDDFAQLRAAAAQGYIGVEQLADGPRWLLRYVRRLPDALAPAHGAVPL